MPSDSQMPPQDASRNVAASEDRLPSLWAIEKNTQCSWKALHCAAEESAATSGKLRDGLAREFHAGDYSIVAFGSLARWEFTPNSDLDWTLLVDGAASNDHWDIARRVRDEIRSVVSKDPGREGTFGSLAFSHELLHQIGGEDDTNRNTTRRILLLLESIPFGNEDAYKRVTRGVLKRYLSEDDAFLQWRSQFPVPRFLLNDFSRFWWTMAVDFAYKRRTRMGEGAVIRNLKLRMSRKLIYAAGLLACFSLALDEQAASALKEKEGEENPECGARTEYFQALLSQPPLEILARHLSAHEHLQETAKKLFSAYNRFLEALQDPRQREELEKMMIEKRHGSGLYQEIRTASHEFRDGLIEVFFDEKTGMAKLTKLYGVF